MEYRRLHEVSSVASITPAPLPRMCRRERLERWAEVLMQEPRRPLRPLVRMEFLPQWKLADLRADDTPLSVAFQDPVLREEGLAGDTVGEAKAFFDLSGGEVHYLLCDCHYQGVMSAGRVAARIKSIANRVTFRELWSRMREAAAARHWRTFPPI
jgi:hypothetical protein